MQPEAIVWGVAIAAAALAALRLGELVMVRSVNNKAFTAVVIKLLKAGNRDRALELCDAVTEKVPYGNVARELVTYSKELSPSDGRSLVAAALRETLDRACESASKLIHARSWMGWLAVAAGAGAMALSMAYEVQALAPSLYLPGGAVIAAVAGWFRARKLAAGCREHGAELVDSLTDYVMSEGKDSE